MDNFDYDDILRKVEIFMLTKFKYNFDNKIDYETNLDIDNSDIKNHPMFHRSKDLRRTLIIDKVKIDGIYKFSYKIKKMNILERKTAYELKIKKDNKDNIIKIDLNFIKNKDKTEFIDYMDNYNLIVYKRNIKEVINEIKLLPEYHQQKQSKEFQRFFKDISEKYPQYYI